MPIDISLSFPSLHSYVHYQLVEKKRVSELLGPEKMVITAYSIFDGHTYLQQGEDDWRGSYSLRYGTYLIPSRYDLTDMVAFPYETDFCVVKMLTTASVKKKRNKM